MSVLSLSQPACLYVCLSLSVWTCMSHSACFSSHPNVLTGWIWTKKMISSCSLFSNPDKLYPMSAIFDSFMFWYKSAVNIHKSNGEYDMNQQWICRNQWIISYGSIFEHYTNQQWIFYESTLNIQKNCAKVMYNCKACIVDKHFRYICY